MAHHSGHQVFPSRAIADSGEGISAEALPHVFRPVLHDRLVARIWGLGATDATDALA
jgi:C4-dicarboxylate-specific signal transduction histidine kinase